MCKINIKRINQKLKMFVSYREWSAKEGKGRKNGNGFIRMSTEVHFSDDTFLCGLTLRNKMFKVSNYRAMYGIKV